MKVYFLSYMLLLSSILIPSYFYSLNTDWYNYSYFVQLVLDSSLTKCLTIYVTNIVSLILVCHSERGNHRLRASAVFKLIWNYFNILTTSRTVPVNIRWKTGQGPEAVNNIEFPIETPFSTYILSGNLPEYRLPDLYMLSFSMLKMFLSPFDEVKWEFKFESCSFANKLTCSPVDLILFSIFYYCVVSLWYDKEHKV